MDKVQFDHSGSLYSNHNLIDPALFVRSYESNKAKPEGDCDHKINYYCILTAVF